MLSRSSANGWGTTRLLGAHLLAAWPTSTSPAGPYDTTDGVVRPSAAGMTRGTPSSTTCMHRVHAACATMSRDRYWHLIDR